VLLNVEVVLAVLLVQVFLKLLEAQGVALFESTVSPVFHLQTLVGQMHEVIFVFQVVHGATGSHVALFVTVDSEVISNCGPDSKIKLTLLVKKRTFNILLDYPEGMFLVSMPYKVYDIIQPFKYFDATSLVK